MKIIARNLPRSFTEIELRQLFQPFGKIKSCDLVMDEKTGKTKGFGFVEMPDMVEAQAAIKELNKKDLLGSIIRVKTTRSVHHKH
ncbi:MAG: RNA-binding protein [Candidatus Neomarinimicrobiota bacterium]